MHHPVSFLYDPINRLLMAVFGESSARWQELMGLHEAGYWLPDHVIMAMLVVVLLAAVLIPLSRRLSVESPGNGQQMLEQVMSGLEGLIDDVVGHGYGKRFLPFIGGLAIFIFTCNIFGLFFFVQPPTANPSTTFALSITAFVYYNLVGIKDNGLVKYLKHFAGPLPLLAPAAVRQHLRRAHGDRDLLLPVPVHSAVADDGAGHLRCAAPGLHFHHADDGVPQRRRPARGSLTKSCD
jgi:F-type H+-transporting ATPase subunit a